MGRKSLEPCQLTRIRIFGHYGLTLKDAARLLETCDATLRNKDLLNDLDKRAHEPTKLNGVRLSKAPNAQWRFRQNEVRRFAPNLYGRIIDSSGEAAEMRAES